MSYEPYQKHQLYVDDYQVSEGGKVKIPENCSWRVLKYFGDCNFGDQEEIGEVALILNEDRGKGHGFWSVISFLTKDEAKDLSDQLIKALEEVTNESMET